MKRIIALWMAGTLLALLVGCNQQEAEPTATEPTPPAVTTMHEVVDPLLPAEDVLSYTKEGSAVTVNVTLAKAAGCEVSLIRIGQHYVFDVDIPEGAKEIRLYAYESRTDGMDSDHADWTVAGFVNDPTRG